MRLPHTEVWKCLNPSCALMFAFPQLDDLALGAAYQNFYYPAPDTGIAAYENTPEQILRQAFDKAEAELGPLAGKSLLDFGCGVGALCKVASEYGIRGDDVGCHRTSSRTVEGTGGFVGCASAGRMAHALDTECGFPAGPSRARTMGEYRQPHTFLLFHTEVA